MSIGILHNSSNFEHNVPRPSQVGNSHNYSCAHFDQGAILSIQLAMTIAALLDHVIYPTLLVNKPCDRIAIEFNKAIAVVLSLPLPVEYLGGREALGDETARYLRTSK